ncbi:MAG: transglutaminase-like domain-containing protein [Bacillota bacterium]|nr:transglutaminase-like domain-containing protein [Bacillota bacterium]
MRIRYALLVYINIMFVFLLSKLCLRVQEFDSITITLVFLAAIAIHLIYVKILKKFIYIFSFTLLLITAATIYYLNNMQGVYSYLQTINSNLLDAGASIYNGANLQFSKVAVVYFILIALITILTMIMYEKNLSNFILIVTITLIITLWYWNYKDKLIAYMPVYMLLTTISYALNKYYNNANKLRSSGVNIKNNMVNIVYIIISVFIVTAVGYIVPKDHVGKYNDIIFAKLNNEKKSDKSNEASNDTGTKNYAFSGINNISNANDTQIGGSMKLDNTPIFYVRADKPLYLKGVNKALYDGSKWTNDSETSYKAYGYISGSDLSIKSFYPLEKSESYYPLALQIQSIEKRGAVEETLDVMPASDFNSNVVFIPYFTDRITGRGDTNPNFTMSYDGYYTVDSIYRGYSVEYYEDRNDIQLFENAHKLGIGNNISIAAITQYYQDNLPNEAAQSRINEVEKYLIVSEKVPNSVRNLTLSITKDCKDNPEKVEKIQQYLKSNYTYSLDVADSGGEEVVSNFLFKQKKGYCVHFATAMTIMCRIAGVPARYVEGIRMSDKKNKDGLYEVTNADAHAWTEVLISPEMNLWCIADATPASSLAVINSSPNNGQNNSAASSTAKPNNSPQPKAAETKKADGSKANILSFKIQITPKLIGVLAVLLVIALILLKVFLNIKKRNKVLSEISMIPLYEYTAARLRTIGYIKSSSIGYMEFVYNIEDEELKQEMYALTKAVYDEAYGKKTNNGFDKQSFYRFLEGYIKQRQNNFIYYLKKLI